LLRVGHAHIRAFAAHSVYLAFFLLIAGIGSLFFEVMADAAVVGFGGLSFGVEGVAG
jgi:hypothetical protein